MQIRYRALHWRLEPNGVIKAGGLGTPDAGLHESEAMNGVGVKATSAGLHKVQ